MLVKNVSLGYFVPIAILLLSLLVLSMVDVYLLSYN